MARSPSGALPQAPPSAPGAPDPGKAPAAHPGTFFLGRYRVVEEIGIGGMASVYLARMDGPGGFQKWVAIKRIHANLVEDDQFVDMFLDEARIAAGINHANVAQVFDLGKDDNTYWIAMEYLHGEPLREIMRRCEERGQLISPDLAARLCADAAEGLHSAHELKGKNGQFLNLVHRDVTPHNLFVTYDGYTKVVDFGIAKVADRLSETRAGTLKGKLAYMSPEQVRGQEDVDRTTDLFALGVVLWELTTGHRLFRMDTDLDTLEKVQACVVPPPSTMVPGYPVELESVVMKALAKRKQDRFQTARDFSRALQTYLMRRGVFVGPEEVAAFVSELFADRIKAREDHLAWAADVTSTINLDQLNGLKAARDDAGKPGMAGKPSHAPNPRPSSGGALMPGGMLPAGVSQQGHVRLAQPPQPSSPGPSSPRQSGKAQPPTLPPRPVGLQGPPSGPPSSNQRRQDPGPPPPRANTQLAGPNPPSLRATVQGIAPLSPAQLVTLGHGHAGQNQNGAPRNGAPPNGVPQASQAQRPTTPDAYAGQGGLAATSLVDDDEDIPTTVAQREHYQELSGVAPDAARGPAFGPPPPASNPGFGSPHGHMQPNGQHGPPSAGYGQRHPGHGQQHPGQAGDPRFNANATVPIAQTPYPYGQNALPSFGPPPSLTSASGRRPSQVETALSLPRPDPSALFLPNGGLAGGSSGGRNTIVLVLVAVMTAVCVVAISVLIFLKYRNAQRTPTETTMTAEAPTAQTETKPETKPAPAATNAPTAETITTAAATATAAPTGAVAVTTQGATTRPSPTPTAVASSGANGFLTVICKPFCDDVRRSGVPLGQSPIVKSPTPPGQYRISLKKGGSPDKVVSVIITSGETSIVRAEMK